MIWPPHPNGAYRSRRTSYINESLDIAEGMPIRSALANEALATGLKSRMVDLHERSTSLHDRASKRRQIAKDVMVELDLKKVTAPDFTVSIRPGMPSLLVLDEVGGAQHLLATRRAAAQSSGIASELKEGATSKASPFQIQNRF